MHPVFLHDGTPAVPATALGQGFPASPGVDAVRGVAPAWISRRPPSKNGQPPHKKMTEPSTGPTSSIP